MTALEAEGDFCSQYGLLSILAWSVGLAVLILGCGLAYCAACAGHKQLLAAQARLVAHANGQAAHQHQAAVRQARQAERAWRAALLPTVGGNGNGKA